MAEKTPYNVLKLVDGEPGAAGEKPAQYVELGLAIPANSSDAAIKAYVESAAKSGTTADLSGTYVATPARSWNPAPVVVETQTLVKVAAT